MHSIDYIVNEYCAKKIQEYLKSEEAIPPEITENFIKSLVSMTKNSDSIGPECEKLYYELNALESYPTGIESKPEEDRFRFYMGAVYGIVHYLSLNQGDS